MTARRADAGRRTEVPSALAAPGARCHRDRGRWRVQVSLVKPTLGRRPDGPFVDEGRMEPLNLGVIAGLTPAGVDVRLWDDRVDVIDYDEPTDLVGITVEAFTARRAYEIAAEFRARRVPVVMGGIHATALPDEVAEHADAVYTGDAETRWAEVVADAHEGRLKPRYDAPIGPAQPGSRAPPGPLRGQGLPAGVAAAVRTGCPFRCEYCAVGAYFDHRHHVRPIDEVVAEIQSQERRDLFFVDDNLIADHAAAKALFRALIPLRVRWVSQASVDQVRDPELMELMVESGCLGNVIGFESLDPGNLRADAQAGQPGRLRPLRRRRCGSCATATSRPGPPSCSATTTTRPSRSRRSATGPSSSASPSRPGTSSCPTRARRSTSGSRRRAGSSTTAAGGCTPTTASTAPPSGRRGCPPTS